MSTDDEQPTEDTENHEDDESVTNQDDVRWVYLGSVLAFILTISLVILILGAAAGLLALPAVTQPWFALYSLSVLTAVGWVFGKELVKKWQS